MKCPHCEMEIPGATCPECGATTPREGEYCMRCGAVLQPANDEPSDEPAFDLDDRVLCPDGTCTGIMVDGKCTECGRAEGDEAIDKDLETKVEQDV